MIDTSSQKVRVNQVISSQLPSFVQEENPLFVDFLKTYYLGEEYQGGNLDISQNFNEYQKVETFSGNTNLIGFTTCTSEVTFYDSTINVTSTEGWPESYGLLKINDEIISYTGKTETSFTGCLRGFSGVESLHHKSDPDQLVFSQTSATSHKNNTQVINLSNLFLQEFWKKTKELFLPGFENRTLNNEVDKANFLRQSRDFYSAKGTDTAVSILFRVLFGKDVSVIKPIEYLIAPSDADYVVTQDIVVEVLSGDPAKVIGQTLRQTGDDYSAASIFNARKNERNGRNYYILSLSKETARGQFDITGGSVLTNNVAIGATVLTVDSTLGFPDNGSFYVGAGITVGIATYSSKSSTQFFGVTGISSSYQEGQFVRSSNTVYAYEGGDITKPVIFRMTAVAHGADLSGIGYLYPGDVLSARNLGNYSLGNDYRLNSWIHNVKTTSNVSKDIGSNRSNIDLTNNTVNTTDPHLLRLGDPVTLVDISSAIPQNVEGTVSSIVSPNAFQLNITSGSISLNRAYKVRSNTIFAKADSPSVRVNNFVANVQNTYTDKGGEYVYVTAGSLPAYTIHATNRKKTFNASKVSGNIINIDNHGYFTGDLVKYRPVGVTSALVGLGTNLNYAITRIDDNNVKLSQSIGDAAVKRFLNISSAGVNHEFVPVELNSKQLQHQNILRRFRKSPVLKEYDTVFQNETVGMFRNGVEVVSNQSGDAIWYGTIKELEVQNGGTDYDVLYPPNINISDAVGTGATAYAIVESGKFKEIEVVTGGYDLKEVPKIRITGGNGTGAAAAGRLKETRTVRSFNADTGVDPSTDTVTFRDRHLFVNGESVYYNKARGFAAVGGLVDNSLYYLHVTSDFKVQFMETYQDAVNGTNPINITSKAPGTNTLTATRIIKVLDSIVVTNEGSGYSNRRAVVSNSLYPPVDYTTVDDINSGINTANNFVFFKKHGFQSGDLIEYNSTGPISGLSTTQNYYVIRIDENRFRVAAAGIGTTATQTNLRNNDYIKFGNIGSASHTFKYPDIHVSVEAVTGAASTTYAWPTVRPICQGHIVQCPVTSVGSGYGATDTINVHRRPNVTVSNGSRALIDVVIDGGKIVRAFVKDGGGGYATPPKLEVRGDGKFARLVANVSGGVITSVSIIDSGKDYTPENTTISVIPYGSGAKIAASVSKWNVDFIEKYKKNISENDDGILVTSNNEKYGLKYVHAYASRKLRQVLNDNIEDDFSEKTTLTHSPILGWAFDGSPIYGPYGYGTPTGGAVRRMVPSYTQVTKGNRPPLSVFPVGTFVEDYLFTNDGDLDQFNGRFCRTPEFPDGVYAYFCTIQATDSAASPFVNTRRPAFPYTINGFKYQKDEFNVNPGSLQSLDILNSGELVRNTYYYKFGVSNSNYDYLTKNQLADTELIVRSTIATGINTVDVILPGDNYRVGDRVRFNNVDSGGQGATAKIKTLVGKGLSTFSYTKTTVPDVSFIYSDRVITGIATTAHGLSDHDIIVISGISTGELKFAEGPHVISVSSVTARLDEVLPVVSETGITTNIKIEVSGVSGSIEVDDTLGIGTERVTVLAVNESQNLYRVRRQTGYATTHATGTKVTVDQRKFSYPVGVQTNLVTRTNRKLVFNPQSTIGFGTAETIQSVVGVGTTIVVRVKATDGTILNDHDLPPSASTADNAITILNHGFITGQKLIYGAGPTGAALTVSNNLDLTNDFQLVEGQTVYAVKKSNDLLGISTTIAGIGTTTTSLYFKVLGDGTEHTFTETNKGYLGHVERYSINVKTVQPHTLRTYDKVKITLSPNTTVNKTIEYDTLSRKTLVDGYYVSAASTFIGVGATNSLINISDHGFSAGDKILYIAGSSLIEPLADRGEYYVQKINDNQFRLSTNYNDSVRFGGAYIGITTFGSGVHKISQINPHIVATRGQTVGFAVSDGSLQDLKLEFFEDENFVTRYEGVGISTEIVRTGTPGVSGSKVNLQLTSNVPSPLYYKLTPTNLDSIDVSKRDTIPDKTVNSGSKIIIENSVYSGSHSITTTGSDTFTYQTRKKPEVLSYSSNVGVTTFKYTTTSALGRGGINEVNVNFGGIGYLRNPGVSTVITEKGLNGLMRLYGDEAGRAGLTEMLKIGFEYPSDKTIQPSVDLPTIITVSNNFSLDQVGVITAGRNYIAPPDLIIPDRPDIELSCTLNGTSVGEVSVDKVGRGFNEVPNPPRIVPIRNTNGIGIVSTSSNGDTNFLTITQPTNGWRADGQDFPFKINDLIYVEGVGTAETTFKTTGGYNSDLYDYRFFTVKTVAPTSSQLSYSIAGLGTTGGTFDPDSSAGRVIKQRDLPTFSALLTPEPFFAGERVTYGANGRAFVLDNAGYNPVTNTLRLRSTTAEIKYGDVIKGGLSGAEGTVRNVYTKSAFFDTGYFAERSKGWQRDTGKLNNDFQKIEDNDYYQNFSYSLKSEIPYETWKPAVDSVVHPTGYKNFSDLVVPSQSSTGFARSADLVVKNVASDTGLSVNVDSIKSFYTVDDFDVASEETLTTGISKFITLDNRKIAAFINIITNKVDVIDDISPQFTGIGTTSSPLVVGLSSFRMTSNGQVLFTKTFDGSDSNVVSAGSSILRLNNHNFQTGERIKYDPGNGVYGNNRISIVSSNVVLGGVTTTFLPPEIYVIKLNNNFLSLAGVATAAERGEALTFNGTGTGSNHSLDVLRPDDRTLITIDDIVQAPLFRKTIGVALDEAVGIGSTTIKVVGVTSITSNDLLNIDNEIMRIQTVGFGSTNVLAVERGVLGSVAAAHTVGAAVTMRGGSYHIVKDVIHFITPPYGPAGIATLNPGVSTTSTFTGRAFNRKDPTTNFIFDDISQNFTGVGKTFTLLQDNANVTGIVTSKNGPEVVNQGVILINNIFQRPEVDFVMAERTDPGIGASVFFTGDDRDSLPRGGIVNEYEVGFGTGYQTILAAAATATVNGAGAIESVTVTGGGSGYRNGPVPIQVLNPLGIGSTAVLQATVGSAGTITGITTVSGGSGYASTTPPIIIVGVATGYSNMEYTGGGGSGFKASVVVGSGGSVIDFQVNDPGIGYRNDDVLTVAGIPTEAGGFSAHTVTVRSIINDSFAGFSFGQVLELDSFADQFDGGQTTFTLTRTTLTKEVININSNDTSIEVGNNLLVFLNDVLQQPGENYIFNGGTQIEFTEPPRAGSKLQILFFRGSNDDVDDGSPFPTVKAGDSLQLQRKGNVVQQKERRVLEIAGVQKAETNLYNGLGISQDRTFKRMVSWTKQTSDLILNNSPLPKNRVNLVAGVTPIAHIIQTVGVNSDQIYVDNAYPLFSALDNRATPNEVPGDGIEIVKANIVDRADATVSVSAGGTIINPTITDPGAGYETVPTVSFASTKPVIKEIGKVWTQRTGGPYSDFKDVTRNVFGLFVGVGTGTGIITSTDGANWYDSGNTTSFGDLNSVIGMGTHTVIVGSSGTVGYSTDGRTFQPSKTFSRRIQLPITFFDDVTVSQDINDVTFGRTIGVAVGAAGTIMFTVNGPAGFGTGFTLTSRFTSQNLNGVAANNNVFVAVGDNGTILRSNDGQTWSGVTTTSITTKLNDITYDNGTWIAVGAAGTIIKSVDNGLKWSVVSSGSTFDLNAVGYANSVWVAVGQSGMVMNSSTTNTWYKKYVGVGTDFGGLAFGDNKFVTVGLASAIYSSEFAAVSAAGTATVSAAGTITSISIDEAGFGYDPNTPVEVLISVEPVIREKVTSVNVEGDYGTIVSVATSSSGINTTSPMVIFDLKSDPHLNQVAFGNISQSGISSGDYFVVTNSVTGAPTTSITIGNKTVGVGSTFLDNVYLVAQTDTSASGIVTVFCNVQGITGIGTTSFQPRIANYSWGRFYSFQRDRLNPRSFTAQTGNGSAGIATGASVVRIKTVSENYSDLDQST
mgnify:FL=1